MKLDEYLDESLLWSRLGPAVRHPSQVVSTVRHLIGMPGPTMVMGLFVEKQNLLERLTATSKGKEWPALEFAPVIQNMNSFVLRPKKLISIEIVGCSDFVLDLEGVRQDFRAAQRPKFVLIFRNCKDFSVKGGYFSGARNVCAFDNCEDFWIDGMTTINSEGYGIVVLNSRFFEIRNCVHLDGLASGLYCLGNTFNGWIHNNVCHGGRGHYNWDAGLHVNHCTPAISLDDVPEQSHEDRRIVDKVLKPSLLYVENNCFSSNRAQGVYCEGAVQCCFESNVILRNNKEGICFDWGSAMNLFCDNIVVGNGERAAMTDAEIKADFIEHFPLLNDGSSSCKLPGISIDNGAFNIIVRNNIHSNYGGAIKAVRTAIGNLIIANLIQDNSEGNNEYFNINGGIIYLGLGPGKVEFSQSDAKLDFFPSEYNICFKNVFRVERARDFIVEEKACNNNYEYGNINIT